jgi:hypothetical protein
MSPRATARWSRGRIPHGRTHRWVRLGWIAALLCLGCISAEDSAAPRPDVLLITVDTLRADHLGAWGHPLPASPRIDELRSLSTTLRHPRVGFSEHLLFVAPRVGAG